MVHQSDWRVCLWGVHACDRCWVRWGWAQLLLNMMLCRPGLPVYSMGRQFIAWRGRGASPRGGPPSSSAACQGKPWVRVLALVPILALPRASCAVCDVLFKDFWKELGWEKPRACALAQVWGVSVWMLCGWPACLQTRVCERVGRNQSSLLSVVAV